MNAIEVFCPGSVANISCGFDILGLCLDSIGDTMRVKKVSKKGITIKSISGYNLSLKTNENAAGVSALALINQYKDIDYGFEIEIIKKIKPGSGIGSSAASASGSVFAINELLGKPFSKKELVKFALDGEYICSKSYHADNISPLIFGGITLVRDHKELDIVNLPTPSELYITIIHPQIELKTSDSRSIIDRNIHISKMTEQSANLGAFISSLYEEDYELLKRSIKDVIIEPYRSELIPEFKNLKKIALKNNALGFGISGSGPSMFSLCKGIKSANTIIENMEFQLDKMDINYKSYISKINNEGLKIL